jgi:uncharacterized protein (TIGR02246 family)
MKIASAGRTQFIGYPTNRVVGTVSDGARAGQAIAALLAAGFRRDDIDILHGEDAIHRLDLTGEEHGLLAQVQRTVIRTFELDEFKHLTDHVEDVRAGRFVLMILAKRRDQRIVASDILHAFGAESVGFYGRWAWTDLPPTGHGSPSDVAILFAKAWNARDANAIASLFDADAEFVDETGVCWHDRESIRSAHASRLQRAVDSTTLATDEPKVKLISPEVAVVHARMTRSDGAAADGATSVAPRTTVVSFVVHRAGERWLCASAHNTGLLTEESSLPEPSGVTS